MTAIDPTQTVKQFATATFGERLYKPTTMRSYTQTLRLLGLEDVRMGDVTLNLLYGSLETTYNRNTVRKQVVALRSLFRDVLPGIRQLKIPASKARVYTLPDEDTLRFALALCPYEFYGLLMMYCGLRVSEAVVIRPQDVHGTVLNVQRQRDENGRLGLAKTQGQVIIPQWMADRIREYKPQTVTSGAVRESFNRYGKMAGIHLNPHMLRHWYCTEMVNRKVNPEIARRQMRHSDLKTTLQPGSTESYSVSVAL